MTDGSADASAELVASLAGERGWSVGAAESLTSGAVASALGAAPEASSWFRGDQPVGTVFIAVFTPQGEVVAEHHFDGPPEAVVEQARDHALALLAEQLAD